MYIKNVCILIIILIVSGCNSSKSKFDKSLSVAVEDALSVALSDNNVIGAVLAIETPNGAKYKAVDGYAIRENNTPMTANLSFRIGSITKTFTTTIILMLIDDGYITLNTTLNEVLPELEIVMGDQITVENLLQMRSGLRKYLADEAFSNFLIYDPERIWEPEELIRFSNYKIGEPNQEFLYNNGNFILLGLMIEKLTDMAYDEVVKKYILSPLNMNNTYLPINLNIPDLFAYGYEYNYESSMYINKTYYLNPTIAWSAGGFISNADDLITWAKVYTNGELISPDLHEKQMTFKVAENNIGIDEYGLGMMKYEGLIGHDGFIPPYGSWIATYKGYKLVLLINGTGIVDIPPLVASYMLTDIVDSIDDRL